MSEDNSQHEEAPQSGGNGGGAPLPDVQYLMRLGAMFAGVQEVEKRPLHVVPEGFEIRDLEHLMPAPTRVRGSVDVGDSASFIAYVKRFMTSGTHLYASQPEKRQIRAVLNGANDAKHPGWGDHCCNLNLVPSPEWRRWSEANNRKMSQAEFAEFIEDNALDIVQREIVDEDGVKTGRAEGPNSADMIEVARGLEGSKSVTWKSGFRTNNGDVSLEYTEETRGQTSKGQIDIPERFFIAIQPFRGSPHYQIEARFRYRIHEGQMRMWFSLYRDHKVLEDAFEEIVTHVSGEIGKAAYRQ